MLKKSFYTEKEALSFARENAHSYRKITVDTRDFETPLEIDSWSGETQAYALYDSELNTIGYVAFWE